MDRRRFIKCAANVAALSALPTSFLYASNKPIPVDVELILAVDMSRSVDADEADLQFRGYADAFRDKNVMDAIKGGLCGQIACMLMIWSDNTLQYTYVPWTVIDGPKACTQFAEAIDKVPRLHYGETSISGALEFAQQQFSSKFEGTRRVIDVSGDGVNSEGKSPSIIRDALVSEGVVINGLPILSPASSQTVTTEHSNLEQYYAENVIGGPLSFVIAAEGFEQVSQAIRKKLIREIANISGPSIEYA